jgi:hypothetical protein
VSRTKELIAGALHVIAGKSSNPGLLGETVSRTSRRRFLTGVISSTAAVAVVIAVTVVLVPADAFGGPPAPIPLHSPLELRQIASVTAAAQCPPGSVAAPPPGGVICFNLTRNGMTVTAVQSAYIHKQSLHVPKGTHPVPYTVFWVTLRLTPSGRAQILRLPVTSTVSPGLMTNWQTSCTDAALSTGQTPKAHSPASSLAVRPPSPSSLSSCTVNTQVTRWHDHVHRAHRARRAQPATGPLSSRGNLHATPVRVTNSETTVHTACDTAVTISHQPVFARSTSEPATSPRAVTRPSRQKRTLPTWSGMHIYAVRPTLHRTCTHGSRIDTSIAVNTALACAGLCSFRAPWMAIGHEGSSAPGGGLCCCAMRSAPSGDDLQESAADHGHVCMYGTPGAYCAHSVRGNDSPASSHRYEAVFPT